MLRNAFGGIVTVTIGQLVLGGSALVVMFGVGYSLAYGTEGLMALGLPRNVAGPIITVLVVAACVYGLYWFATRMIDW